MKKITLVLLTLALIFGCVAMFVSCGTPEEPVKEKTVMNISMNPEVEFVLDEDGKVISVNALNEEGNLVISAAVFVGEDAEAAAELFVSVSKEMGFIVSGNAGIENNDINISISGDLDKAEELYNGIKTKLDGYFSEENITAAINQAEAITKEQLEALLAECAPYLEEAEIKAMEYKQLVEELYASRKETAEFYSQELKNAYYEAKAFALEQAEFEVLKSHLGFAEAAAFEIANSAYVLTVEQIEQLRMVLLVNEDSAYQLALKTFREQKTEYLAYREELAANEDVTLTEEQLEALAALDEAVAKTEEALVEAAEAANAQLDKLKATAAEMRDRVIAAIQSYSQLASEHLDSISAAQLEAKTEFFTEFEAAYAAAIEGAEEQWNGMHNDLTSGSAEKTE